MLSSLATTRRYLRQLTLAEPLGPRRSGSGSSNGRDDFPPVRAAAGGAGRPPVVCLVAGPPVDRYHRRPAQADVVLQRQVDVIDLPVLGLAAQLPAQLRALSQAGGTERVPLG